MAKLKNLEIPADIVSLGTFSSSLISAIEALVENVPSDKLAQAIENVQTAMSKAAAGQQSRAGTIGVEAARAALDQIVRH